MEKENKVKIRFKDLSNPLKVLICFCWFYFGFWSLIFVLTIINVILGA